MLLADSISTSICGTTMVASAEQEVQTIYSCGVVPARSELSEWAWAEVAVVSGLLECRVAKLHHREV